MVHKFERFFYFVIYLNMYGSNIKLAMILTLLFNVKVGQ